MASAMAAAHLVISRAGAITLAEICAAGRPSILIPLTIAGGHQIENARVLVEAGAAEMLSGEEEGDRSLAMRLAALFDDRSRLEAMSAAARDRGLPRATEHIADRVEHWALRRRRKEERA